ncbi:hypothetical protein HOLleu_32158 [Holothuria leucospilota]|uniref:Uncharacterized protein n=1 Tax=Holothuria leucospilota TaxID=206669 RepID=A0A9Q1BGR7_HOLLE|nr:hypothetical protein HOLleu_32158 [Holothuria leucospilota]
MELSHLFTKSIMVAVVTLLTLCLAIGVQGQETTTPGGLPTNAETDMTTLMSPTDVMTTSAGMTTQTPEMKTSKAPTTKPRPPVTTGKTEPSGTSPAGPTQSPIKGGFKWATFFCIIILIGCLVGIGYCAYQFYRKRQTDSYHTL